MGSAASVDHQMLLALPLLISGLWADLVRGGTNEALPQAGPRHPHGVVHSTHIAASSPEPRRTHHD